MPKNVKNTTFPGLFDLLAPHSCRGCGHIGTPLCERCKNYIISEHATYQPDLPAPFNNRTRGTSASMVPSVFVLGPRAGLVGKLVHDLKYDSARAIARALAELLDATLPDFKGPVSLVPLPTSTAHIRARGLDHTLLIAKRLARIRGYKVERILLRARNTTQVGTSATARLAQAAAAYELSPHFQAKSKAALEPGKAYDREKSKAALDPDTTYLLLDDVWTTGASMTAAMKLFQTLRPKKLQLVLLARN